MWRLRWSMGRQTGVREAVTTQNGTSSAVSVLRISALGTSLSLPRFDYRV